MVSRAIHPRFVARNDPRDAFPFAYRALEREVRCDSRRGQEEARSRCAPSVVRFRCLSSSSLGGFPKRLMRCVDVALLCGPTLAGAHNLAETVARQWPRRRIFRPAPAVLERAWEEGFQLGKSSLTTKVWFKAISASAVTACVPCEVRWRAFSSHGSSTAGARSMRRFAAGVHREREGRGCSPGGYGIL